MAFGCCSSETGAKVIAIFSLIVSGFLLVTLGGVTVFTAVRHEKVNSTEEMLFLTNGIFGNAFLNRSEIFENVTLSENVDDHHREHYLHKNIAYLGFNFVAMYTFLSMYNLVVSMELLHGVRQRNYWRCNIWFMWGIGSLIASVTYTGVYLFFVTTDVVSNLIQISCWTALSA